MGFKLSSKLLRDQVKSNRNIYLPTFIMGSILMALVYIIFAMGDMIARGQDFMGYRSLGTVFKTLTYVFAIISFAVFFYLNSFLAKRRSLSYGLYGVLGLGRRDLIKLNFLECLGLGLSISLLGSVLGFALGRLVFAGLLALTKLDNFLKISYQFSAAALRQTLVLFACIFLAIFLFNSFTILKANLRDLLDGPETGEREPKAKWLVTIISLGLLLGAYYLANLDLDPLDAMKMFFPAVLMVIVGTYGVFMAVTIFLLKALKRKKSLYYQPRPFINISNLLFRMKANAAGLATISILFTCAFLTFSTTSTLYWGLGKKLAESAADHEFVADLWASMGTLLFIGLYFIVFFLLVSGLVVYFKQLNEAYADRKSFVILQELGLDQQQVKSTIRTQILIMFFLPLAFSVLNVIASYKILNTLLQALGQQMLNTGFFLKMSVVSVLVFTLIYLLIYQATAQVYYRIVRRETVS